MSNVEITLAGQVGALLAVRIGRDGWVRKEAILHYEDSRLIKVEGIDLAQTGPMGLTGTLYVVKDSLCRDNRLIMRIERQKIVNGKVLDMQNWGEIEVVAPRAA